MRAIRPVWFLLQGDPLGRHAKLVMIPWREHSPRDRSAKPICWQRPLRRAVQAAGYQMDARLACSPMPDRPVTQRPQTLPDGSVSLRLYWDSRGRPAAYHHGQFRGNVLRQWPATLSIPGFQDQPLKFFGPMVPKVRANYCAQKPSPLALHLPLVWFQWLRDLARKSGLKFATANLGDWARKWEGGGVLYLPSVVRRAGKLTRSRRSKRWQVDGFFFNVWVVMYGRS